MRLVLPDTLHAQICQQLEQSFPNEGGGFLVGTLDSENRVVTEVHPVENVFEADEQFHRFLAESGAFERIEDDADARGLVLLGYYHSHPNSPAIPSEYDRIHAWPFFAYLIVSVQDGQTDHTRLWQLQEDRSQFIEASLIIGGN